MSISRSVRILDTARVAFATRRITVEAADIAAEAAPGRFLNILTDPGYDPLLRRPYSISDVREKEVDILFSVVGKGTSRLAALQEGDWIEVLGPLGNSFGLDRDFGTAVLVGGGIGIAPFPLATRILEQKGRPFHVVYGTRTAELLIRHGGIHLPHVHHATDDGTAGFQGNVIGLLEELLPELDRPMLFACGPTPMLAAVQAWALAKDLPCELSLESEMACGIGICQGCPVPRESEERSYALACTEGPCFDARSIRLCTHHGGVA